MRTSTANPYCEVLGIQAPTLEAAKNSPAANSYSLLIVASLERGAPMTLEEAARRFEEARIAPAFRAFELLKRCKPGRPPIYRDGGLYSLDPHDQEADRWAFRLGLRPPKVAALPVVRPDPGPLPSPDEPLSIADLDEVFHEGVPGNWSAQRIAICVTDAHQKAMAPDDVLAFVRARSQSSPLSTDSARHWREGAAIRVRHDELWELDVDHDAVRSTRQAVRERIVRVRRSAQRRPDPSAIETARKDFEPEREANAQRFAQMRRVVIHAFPPRKPEAVALVDVGRREVTTFIGEEIVKAREKLAAYNIIAVIDVRVLLRAL